MKSPQRTLRKMHSYNTALLEKVNTINKTQINNNFDKTNYWAAFKRERFKNIKLKKESKSCRNLIVADEKSVKKYDIAAHSIPGKIKESIKKNKDVYFQINDVLNDKNNILIGVIDGNGIYGKEISEYIKDNFCIKFMEKFDSDNIKDFNLSKNEIINSLKYLFIELNKNLFIETSFNLLASGCTLSIVLIINNLIFSCNIGNSKIIMWKKESDKLIPVELSKNHDIFNEKELERILSNGGELRKVFNSDEKRIFIKDNHYPSLKITRAFGNSLGRKIGIIENPYISICKLKKNIVSIIMGTNGFWKKTSPFLLVNSYGSYNNISYCSKLIKLCKKEWLKNKDYNEDITCLTIEFSKL